MMNTDLSSRIGKGKFGVAAYHILPVSNFMQNIQPELTSSSDQRGKTDREAQIVAFK